MPMNRLCLPRIAEPIKLTVLRSMDEVGWGGKRFSWEHRRTPRAKKR